MHCLDRVSQRRIVESSEPDANVISSLDISKQLIFCLLFILLVLKNNLFYSYKFIFTYAL